MTAIIAVDLGNSRAKFGYFSANAADEFPEPESVLACGLDDEVALGEWQQTLHLEEHTRCLVARTVVETGDKLSKLLPYLPASEELSRHNVPIALNVDCPDKVGIDRILAAFGAIAWHRAHAKTQGADSRADNLCALVVDAGSAMTVDWVDSSGTFCGGAILPGLEMAAFTLAKISPRLPRMDVQSLTDAHYPGKNTEQALAAGMLHGAVGAILHLHRLVAQQSAQVDVPIILTGGDAETIFATLSQYMDASRLVLLPNLVLTGIALAAQKQR